MTENKSTESKDSIVVHDANTDVTGDQEVQVRPASTEEWRWVRPELDVFESESELLLKADMPGVGKDQISLTLDQGQLTLEGRWSHEVADDLVFSEHTPVNYRRVLRLPNGLDLDQVTARLGDGVLEVHLPFAASMKPRQIQVQGVH